MATNKQIRANRANAEKSTGPRTPEGKAIASRNSVRYELLAKSFVLASECPARFQSLVESFYEEYSPATPSEAALVDAMATATWRLTRMSNLEAAIIDHEYSQAPDTELPTAARATLAYRRANDSGRSIEMMNRAEARLQHQFNSAFDRLQSLRPRPKSAAK